MIICIDISQRTKDELDRLLAAGSYRDYSEAVSLAIANQLLLHSHSTENTPKAAAPELIVKTQLPSRGKNPNISTAESNKGPLVPELFSDLGSESTVQNLAPYPED